MEDTNKSDLMIKTAKLYYEEGLGQAEISRIIGYSRPYVSKLIADAQKCGIVTIKVRDSMNIESTIERTLRVHFRLLRAFEIHAKLSESGQTKVAAFAASYLPTLLKSGDILAVGRGNTMYRCAETMENQVNLDNISVVQMCGNATDLSLPTYNDLIPTRISQALNGTGYCYPVPAVIDDPDLRKRLYDIPAIAKLRELQSKSNVAIFTTDTLSLGHSSSIVRSGFVSPEKFDELKKKGAVCAICNHFIREDGSLADPEFDKSVTSIPLDELLNKQYRICIASGRAKYQGVFAALNGGYANILIADDDISRAISILTN